MIRFGIIGCGMIGSCHAQVISQSERLRLEAVYDHVPAAAQRLSAHYGCHAAQTLDELLSLVDAVAVCLPTNLHFDAVMKAARAKKHVVCEKPVSAQQQEAEEMIRCCRENGVLLSVIFQHRFDPAVIALKAAVSSGALGRILWASVHSILYREKSYFSSIPWHAQKGSGALMNQSIHYIDLLVYLLGNPVSVTGHCSARLHDLKETEDTGLALLEFESGVPAVIEGTTAAYPGLYNELSVYGEKGSFIIRNDELFSYHLQSGSVPEYDALLNPSAIFTAHRDAKIDLSSHQKQYHNIAQAILGLSPLLVTGEEGLKSVRLINAIYQSAQEHAAVCLKH